MFEREGIETDRNPNNGSSTENMKKKIKTNDLKIQRLKQEEDSLTALLQERDKQIAQLHMINFNESAIRIDDKENENNRFLRLLIEEREKDNKRYKSDVAKQKDECDILKQANESLTERLENKKKAKILKNEKLLELKERLALQTKYLFDLILDACKLKLESLIKSVLLSISIYLVVSLCIERNFGLIHLLSNSTNTNHFFIAIAFARLLFYPSCFFLIADSFADVAYFSFFCFTAFLWILTCVLSRVIFPTLIGHYYFDSTNIEISPPVGAKTSLFLLLFLSNFTSQTISSTCWNFCAMKLKSTWLPDDLRENKKRNFRSIFIRSVKMEGIVALFIFFLCLLIVGIGSLPNIPNLNQNIDIFLFGYCFPIIKAAVATVSYGVCMYFSTRQHWKPQYTSKMTSAFAMAAVTVCTISQLYIVFRNANDYPLFLYQYLPHEIIKKISWLTFHPLYLKIKMRVIEILSSSFNNVIRKKDKFDRAEVKNRYKRRLTNEVFANLGATAGEIVGRQFGEDLCMIIICIWMLPISQEFLFNQIYPSSSSLPFPSYENIGVMIIGAAYGSETILTILCFVILQRVGIPLMTNRQVLELNAMTWGMYIFSVSGGMLVLAATFIY